MSNIRGRFSKPADKLAALYTASLSFDRRLYKQDITGSIAHVKMLAKQDIISEDEAEVIVGGLEAIRAEIEKGKFKFAPEQEDIHMAIEARLIEKVGEVGRKLHTARSRNDQVALDMRLFLKEAIADSLSGIRGLEAALLDVAEANKSVVMPGYTHLQVAQPVLLAHHLLAYFEMLQRDYERFSDCLKRADVMPLGSGALAGVAFKIDREFLAKELGFSKVSQNSLDAVADRDYILEYQAAAAICMMHLSRLAEEIVLWSSAEFGFIELDDAYATGSSIMPQKKNPDVAELARGKTGRVYGNLIALLTTMKGLPLAYNRDMQEDKEGLFDTVDTLLATLSVLAGMVATIKVNAENTRKALERGYVLATDLADYLVKKGAAFRTAHEIVGKLVNYAAGKGKTLAGLDMKEYKKFSPLFNDDVRSITIESSLAARDVVGGTAPGQVKKALAAARRIIKKK
ncbi:MAG: argininosuccinate lyase [Chloroflexi bacterium RBG_13_51_18]|nr:MAG: argininosuccinate lyase [Chloroflexi bacterium RBG_13_51_18]